MITREWRRPGLKFSCKRTPNEELNFRQHQDTARNTERERRIHREQGEEEHEATTRDRQGTGPPVNAVRGGSGVRMVESGRERKVSLDGRTLGPTGI